MSLVQEMINKIVQEDLRRQDNDLNIPITVDMRPIKVIKNQDVLFGLWKAIMRKQKR